MSTTPELPGKRLGGVNLRDISITISIAVAVLSAVSSWSIIPYRLDQAEARIEELEKDANRDRELLIEIKTTLAAVQAALEDLKSR